MLAVNKERMLAVINGEKPDRVPRYASFTSHVEEALFKKTGTRNFSEYFDMDNPVCLTPEAPESLKSPDFSEYYSGIKLAPGTKINSLGVAHEPGNFYHFTHIVSPLRREGCIPIRKISGVCKPKSTSQDLIFHSPGLFSLHHEKQNSYQSFPGYVPIVKMTVEATAKKTVTESGPTSST
jgi:hypothetical protein